MDKINELLKISYENTDPEVMLIQTASELAEAAASITAYVVSLKEGNKESQRFAEFCEEIADARNMIYQAILYIENKTKMNEENIKNIQLMKAKRRVGFIFNKLIEG